MKEVFVKVDVNELVKVRILEDFMNLIILYNLKKNFDDIFIFEGENDDISVDVDEMVVMIIILDKLLFNFGSYRINLKVNNFL